MKSKKMTAKTKKSVAADKKRIYAKEMIMRKRKRREDKIAKKMKKISKSKRIYRRRFQNSFVSIFSRKNASEMKQSIFQVEKSEVDSSASSMKSYTYQ
jgi:ribosomal protein L9